MALIYVKTFAIQLEIDIPSVDDDQLVVMLNTWSARPTWCVQDVANDCGSAAHSQVFMANVF